MDYDNFLSTIFHVLVQAPKLQVSLLGAAYLFVFPQANFCLALCLSSTRVKVFSAILYQASHG
jgi:hypothetical protein